MFVSETSICIMPQGLDPVRLTRLVISNLAINLLKFPLPKSGTQLTNLVGVFKNMAKEYFEKLSNLIRELNIEDEVDFPLEIKHFFSGAALYVNGTIRVSWSPVGLAFKLPKAEVNELIKNGKAKPLRYFPKGNIKKGYALFENPRLDKPNHWKIYFIKAAQQS
jgi:hypothetical protein